MVEFINSNHLVLFFFLFDGLFLGSGVLEIEPTALHLKHSTTELHPQSFVTLFFFGIGD